MPVNVIAFGQVADITGTDMLTVENARDTNSLINELNTRYPNLSATKFAVAVDKKIIKENTSLNHNSTIALLPPFSGG